MNTYSSTFQHIHCVLTSCLFGHTNSNVFLGFIIARSPHSHRGGSSSHLTTARCFSLAVIGRGQGGWNPLLEVLTWMSPSKPIVEKEVPRIKLVCTIDPLKEKTSLMGLYNKISTEYQQHTYTNEEKKIVETITYIKTSACVEATRRCVWMFRLKNMSRETTVIVRDREVRRDGSSLLDASGYNSRGRPRFCQNSSRYISCI